MKSLSLIAVALLATSAICGDPLVVNTCNGRVRGKLVHLKSKLSHYFAFKCIPYAKAPVDKLRFMAPKPAENWEGVLKEDTCNMCPQVDLVSNVYIGDEDCLKLNVYTPVNPDECDKNNPLPVIVFIHGGEWRLDFADRYSPNYFMRTKKVIVVTLNYRLGPFGFLSTGDEIVPGNNGLKDQHLALEWVQENIRSFGGNPRKVTIFGSSEGAASVHLHMISPKSKGLFIGAIASGGNALNTWAWTSTSESVRQFRKLSTLLNCTNNNFESAVNCMKGCSAKNIVMAEENNFSDDRLRSALVAFRPVTEVPNEHAFLCQNPVDVVRNGGGNQVPLILGFTEHEGAHRYVELWKADALEKVLEHLEWILPTSSPAWRLEYGLREDIVCRVRDYYLPKDCWGSPEQLRTNLINLISDAWFLQGHNTLLRIHSDTQSAPIYQYVLTYRGEHSFTDWYGYGANLGASHYDEELYLFPSETYFEGKITDEDKAMIERMIEFWTHFATHQTPTPTTDDIVDWKPVHSTDNEYLEIAGPNELCMKTNFNYERAEFWRDLAYEFGTYKKSCCAAN